MSSMLLWCTHGRWEVEVTLSVSLTNMIPPAHHCPGGLTSVELLSTVEDMWRPRWLLKEYCVPECLNVGGAMANLGQSWHELFQICIDNPLIMLCLQCDMIPHGSWPTVVPDSCKIFITFKIYITAGLDSSVPWNYWEKNVLSQQIHKRLRTASHSDCYVFWQPERGIFCLFLRSRSQFPKLSESHSYLWLGSPWGKRSGRSARGGIISAWHCLLLSEVRWSLLVSVFVPHSVKGQPKVAAPPVLFIQSPPAAGLTLSIDIPERNDQWLQRLLCLSNMQ